MHSGQIISGYNSPNHLGLHPSNKTLHNSEESIFRNFQNSYMDPILKNYKNY